MEQTRNLYVGFDLGNENSQMSCFHPRTGEIETIGAKGKDYYFIPTCLAVNRDKREWLFGEEAIAACEQEDVSLIDNIVDQICKNETFTVFETTYEAVTILEKFFRKTLILLQAYYSNDFISKLVVTIEKDNSYLVKAIDQALGNMGIFKDRVLVETYTQSYIYYALNQKRELWPKNIGLFDYSKRGLVYKYIQVNRKSQPWVISCVNEDLSTQLSYDIFLQNEKKQVARAFLEAAQSVLYNQDVATLYFAGEGFLSNWSDAALSELCAGKRGFRGPNIYTRGAAYHAKNLVTNEFERRFLLLSEGVLEYALLLKGYKDGKIRDIEMIPAGILWNQAKHSVTIILDEEEEIRLVIKNVLDMTTSERMINLEGMPKRPNRMGRFQLDFQFENLRTCVIYIRDVGFGEYAPSTKRVWEKRIEL
ncbi:MAG: DUF5716 family protein [Velocimicrobium sp.]